MKEFQLRETDINEDSLMVVAAIKLNRIAKTYRIGRREIRAFNRYFIDYVARYRQHSYRYRSRVHPRLLLELEETLPESPYDVEFLIVTEKYTNAETAITKLINNYVYE